MGIFIVRKAVLSVVFDNAHARSVQISRGQLAKNLYEHMNDKRINQIVKR